jgi:hypothetical protein
VDKLSFYPQITQIAQIGILLDTGLPADLRTLPPVEFTQEASKDLPPF